MKMSIIKTSTLGIVLTVTLLSLGSLSAQDYVVPRTVDGQPDLQGLWTNDTITPMERPASLEGREFLTPEEISELETNVAQRREFADNNIVVVKGGS